MPTTTFKSQTLDARPDRLDLRDREYRPPLVSLPPQWPTEDLIKHLLPSYTNDGMILNQGGEGACTGFGLAAVINYLLWRDDLTIVDGKISCAGDMHENQVSPRMLYNMARVYDEWDGEDYEGSSCRGAMKGWHRHGVCKETTWPYSTKNDKGPGLNWAKESVLNPLGAYYRISRDSVVDMQAAIYEVGAIYCSASVHEGWWRENDKTLQQIKYSRRRTGGHSFAIIGYNQDGFIIQNSWGTDWGYNGFAIHTYEDWVENGNDAWVVVRGAPIRKSSPSTFSHHPLQSIANDATQRVSSGLSKALNYPYKKPQVRPWSEEQAYHHSLVIENNGRPKLTLITTTNPDASAKVVCHDNLAAWLKESATNKKVVIYAHGGLNDEEDSISRIRVMAPYFKANGIYPIYLTWKTGFLESIGNQISDHFEAAFNQAGIDPDSAKAQGILDKLREPIDRRIEKIAQKFKVRGVWTEMKENAKFANDRAVPGFPQQGNVRPGAMVILAKALSDLKKKHNFEIHLIGHSAGSILLGHWLNELIKRKLKVKSTTLYAPACTLEFANRHYTNACNKKVLNKKDLSIHLMDDERELGDTVGPYGKSLLYLISRSLEDIHKMPLLGMAAAWDPENAQGEDGKFNTSQHPEIENWNKFARGSANKVRYFEYDKYHSEVTTSQKGDKIDLAHGSFDNDIKVVEQTIKEINNNKPLKFRVENLGGF